MLLFSQSVVFNSLRPHGLQHPRLPCPSPSSRACANSCPLSQWCHPTTSSLIIPFSSCLQSYPASGSFLMSWLFTSGGQSIGASASASVLSVNIQDWFPLGMTGLISLLSRGLSRVLYSTTVWKHEVFNTLPSLWSNSHPYMTTGKTTALTTQIFIGKVMSLRLLILWLQSLFAVILEPPQNKICHFFHFLPINLPWSWWDQMPWS